MLPANFQSSIGPQRMKYVKLNYGGYNEFSREMELKQIRHRKKNWFRGNDLWRLWKYTLYQLEIDMDPMYVRLLKVLGDSLGHQCYLTTCVLGQYPSLHSSGKTDNCFATNDNSWFTSWVGTSQSGRGHFSFRLEIIFNG